MQVSTSKVWSSELTQNKILERAKIDDVNTGNTTVWSSSKTLDSIVTAAGVVIDDGVASDITTWSSKKINDIVAANKSIKVENFGDTTIAGSGTTPEELENTSDGAMIVNINISVSTTQGTAANKDKYLGDLTVFYNNTSQICVKESIISKNDSDVSQISCAIGNVILDSGDKLLFVASSADVWTNCSVTAHYADISKSGEVPDPSKFSNGLLFTSLQNGSTIQITDSSDSITLEYKIEVAGSASEIYDYTSGTKLTLNQGDKIIFRNKSSQTGAEFAGKLKFSMTGKFISDKSVNYLYDINGTNFNLNPNQYKELFFACSALTQAPKLPAVNLAANCYENMFGGCSGLTSTPSLPATTLAESCYKGMFSGCTNLTKATYLIATTVVANCYQSMFQRCTALVNGPDDLPASILAPYCYDSMFSGCTSLVKTPILYGTTLAEGCYKNMFNGCSELADVSALDATALQNYSYQGMFEGCSKLNIQEKDS